MRIKRLDLIAFGPFTKAGFEFDSEDPGLHIVFGKNEFGKSSSLRALKALLFGFPLRTSDNFKHPNDQLLVGGCLTRTDGKVLELQRRKKNKNDLLDPDGNPIDPSVLSTFLHGIDEKVFDSLYGLDHQILVEGGQDILAQKGEVGQALFAAGAGISSFRKILEGLDAEADQLFSARATTKHINKAIKKYKELRKSVKEASLPGRNWKEHQKTLLEAKKERGLLQKKRDEKEIEKRNFERLKRAIPLLSSRNDFKERLEALGQVPMLPEHFAQRQQSVNQGLRDKKLEIEKAKNRCAVLHEESSSITIKEQLLDCAETIEEHHQALGEYRKGMSDRRILDEKRIGYHHEAIALLRQVSPNLPIENVETLRPLIGRKKTIKRLSHQRETLLYQVSEAKEDYQSAAHDLKEVEKALSLCPERQDASDLMQVIKLAQGVGDIDEQIASNAREVETEKKFCLSDLKRIGLWSGDFQNLISLTLPMSETINHYENCFKALEDNKKQLQKDRIEFTKELNQTKSEIKKIEYAGDVPTETDLQESRSKRDQGWNLIRKQWLKDEKIDAESSSYDPLLELPEAFEKYTAQADQVSDRLRREAERVASFAEHRARSETLELTLSENIQIEIKSGEDLKILEAQWVDIWKESAIVPRSPKEMLPWLNDFNTLCYKVKEVLKKDAGLEEKRAQRSQTSQLLTEALNPLQGRKSSPHETLRPLLLSSERVLETITKNHTQLDKLEEKRSVIQKTLADAEIAQTSTEVKLQSWEAEWKEVLVGLEIGKKISPSEASDILDDLQACFGKLNDADVLRKRIDGINRDATEYEKEVGTLLEQAAPNLPKQNLEQAVINLNNMQKKASQDKALLEKTRVEIKKAEEEMTEAKTELESLEEQIKNLLSTASCKTDDELTKTIQKSAEAQKLKEKLTDLETTLVQQSEGIPLDELGRKAKGVSSDELPGKISSIQQEIEELNQEINRLSEEIGNENKTLNQMDGSAKAVQAAEEMERVSAKIQRLTDQYVRTKLASKILHQEIDRYRAEHQDPVLSIASNYFSQLTLSSFSGIRTDTNDKGNPILVGMRPNKTRVTVEGMSTGSRDQLFLSLRLATLEWRLKSSEPMPLIVDDILINFDDERSRATLKTLADLGEKNQVILFTHHRQILEDAKRVKGKASINIYEL